MDQLTLGDAIRVIGKGNRERRVEMPSDVVPFLQEWFRVRGNHNGPAFNAIHRTGSVTQRRLSAQAVLNILTSRAKQAGIPQCTPHDARRTYITNMLRVTGGDLNITADLVGHQSTGTTRRYDKRGEEDRRVAVEKLGNFMHKIEK